MPGPRPRQADARRRRRSLRSTARLRWASTLPLRSPFKQLVGEIVDAGEELRIERADVAEHLGRRAVGVRTGMGRVDQGVVQVDLGPVGVVARGGRVRGGDDRQDAAGAGQRALRAPGRRRRTARPCSGARCRARHRDCRAGGPRCDSRIRIFPSPSAARETRRRRRVRLPAMPEPRRPLKESGSMISTPSLPQKRKAREWAAAVSGSPHSSRRWVPGQMRCSTPHLRSSRSRSP